MPSLWNRIFSPKSLPISNYTVTSNSPIQVRPVTLSIAPQIPVIADYDIHHAVRAYNQNGAVYAIVDAYAKKMSEVPLYLAQVNNDNVISKGKVKKLVKAQLQLSSGKTQLQALLNKPNADESWRDLLTKIATSYKLLGEAFIFLNRGDQQDPLIDSLTLQRMKILEMDTMPAQYIEVLPDISNPFRGVGGYIFRENGQAIYFRKENVIHIKNNSMEFNLYTRPQLRGISPLKSGNMFRQLHDDTYKCMLNMTQNNGSRNALFIKSDQNVDLSAEEMSKLKQDIDSTINNMNKSGSASLSAVALGNLQLSKATDIDLIKIKDSVTKDLCMAFKVPFEKIESATTFNNKETSFRGWVQDSIVPDCNRIAAALSSVLTLAFGVEDVVISCDISVLSELQEKVAINGNVLTYNEQRIELGYDPIEVDPNADINDQPVYLNTVIPANNLAQELDSITAAPVPTVRV